MVKSNEINDKRAAILRGLEPLFIEAITDGKWFYCRYRDLWFSPAELREYHMQGRFIWGVSNWALRFPDDAVEAIDRDIDRLTEGRDDLISRIKTWQRLS